MNGFRASLVMFAACAFPAALRAGAPQTSFTYQGQLKNRAEPASGSYDVQFRLFDDVGPLAGPICADNVAVTNGFFSLELDFGDVFDGRPIELEVGIRAGAGPNDCAIGAYTTLSPRQPIRPVPYAMNVPGIDGYSLDAADGLPLDVLLVDDDGNIGIGTPFPLQKLHMDNGNMIMTAEGFDPYIQMYSNGLLDGTSTKIKSLNGVGFAIQDGANNTQFVVQTNGGKNVGVGTTTPTYPLDVVGRMRSRGAGSSGGGIWFSRAAAPGTDVSFLGRGGDDQSWTGIYVGAAVNWPFVVTDGGSVGIGATNPVAKLHVAGSAVIGANVGIGTLTPTARLHIGGDAGIDGIRFPDGSFQATAAAGDGHSLNAADGSPLDALYLDNNGRVGIGTTTPSGPIHIVSTATPPGGLAGAQNGLLLGSYGETGYKWVQSYAASLALNPAGNNVGVGTSSPTHRLHVYGEARFRSNTATNLLLSGSAPDDSFIDFIKDSNTTPAARIAFDGFADQAIHRAFLRFLTRGAADSSLVERMTITDSGDVGIGTNSPSAKLDVVKSAGGESAARFRQSSAGVHTGITIDGLSGQDAIVYFAENGTVKWGLRNDSSDASSFQLRYHDFGFNETALKVEKIGPGIPSVGYRMHFDGQILPVNDNAADFGALDRRWQDIYATNPIISTSDARLKTEVRDLSYGISEILSLRPVQYRWREESDGRIHLGLISQEVEPVIPEAIVKDDSDPQVPWSLTYSTFIPVLIKAVQEQQAMIEAQRGRIDALESELSEIKKRIASGDVEARLAGLEAAVKAQRPAAGSPD
jgi:hypothetical protein